MNRRNIRIKHYSSFILTLKIAFSVLMLTWFRVTDAATPAMLPDWQIQGTLKPVDQWLVAQDAVAITAPLVPDATTRIYLRLGELQRTASCRVEVKDGYPLELSLTAMNDAWVAGAETNQLPNAYVQVGLKIEQGETLFSDRYYVRPHPSGYEGEDRKRILTDWQKFPGATERALELRIEASGKHVGFWLDDRYVGGKELPDVCGLRFQLSPGNAVSDAKVSPLTPARDRFVQIPTRGYRRAGTLKIVEMLFPGGTAQVVNGVPFCVADNGDEIDVGKSRWLAEATGPQLVNWNDKYYWRSAFDSRPEDILLAVPADDYVYAHLLCVVDPNTAKTPAITLRLTRYLSESKNGGGRGVIADSLMRLEQIGGAWPEGCQLVGRVKVKTESGEDKILPLLSVKVPLKGGQIQDILEEKGLRFGRSTQSLDLELTKELHAVDTIDYATHATKPLGKQSGVHVYGLTLERSPLNVRLRSGRVGQIFYQSEDPALNVEMENQSGIGFEGKLAWQIIDFYGHCKQGERDIVVPASGKLQSEVIDVRQQKYGWFGVKLTLRDRSGQLIWECPTSFAILPPDTRKTGSESPYGSWWFSDGHLGTSDFEKIGPLFQRAGLRHVCPAQPISIQSQTQYGVNWSMQGWNQPPQSTVGWAMVFHETSFSEEYVYPPEFIGRQPPKLNADQEKKFKELWDKAIAVSKLWREKFPDVKLIFGNSTTPFLAEFLRRGYPREYVDAIGNEDCGAYSMPEAPPGAMQSLFWEKEYAKLYKYNVPMTSCYEWRGRNSIDGTSELEQARLYVRDLLQGLAFRLPHINIGLICDSGDAYYFTRFGSGGICHRYPLLNPKISYVALATATRQLDGAVFQRCLNTGSPSLYAMQFTKDKRLIYVLWVPRGERDVALTFAGNTTFELTDMNGNGRKIETKSCYASISVSASPVYMETDVALESLSGGPTMCEPLLEKPTVIDSLTDRRHWTIAAKPDKYLDTCQFDFPRNMGRIDVDIVADDQRKQAMQLTLQPQPDVPWPIARYVSLKAANGGIQVPGAPTSIGVWVRGNSGWGRVFWEFKDASGKLFISLACFKSRFSSGAVKSGQTFINFDGWNYLSVELPFRYASGFYGPSQNNWTRTGGDGNWPPIGPDVAYPIRITRLIVELRDKVVYLTDPVDVHLKSVRLRDLSATYGARDRQ